jgi:hypothetical protein
MSEPTFHAGSKLAWAERGASDRNVTDFQARVMSAIARRINGRGVAEVSQETISNIIGARGVRGVAKALAALQRLGYLELVSRGGGRGRKSCFRPIMKTPNGHSGFDKETPNTRSGFSTPETPNGHSHKPRTAVPVVKIPYKNPPETPSKTDEPEPPLRPSPTNICDILKRSDVLVGRWQAMKLHMAESHSRDLVGAWFGDVQIDRIDGSALVLEARNKFIARQIEANHTSTIMSAWRRLGGDPAVRDVRVEVAAGSAVKTRGAEPSRLQVPSSAAG